MGSELGAMRGLVRNFVVGVALGGLIGVTAPPGDTFEAGPTFPYGGGRLTDVAVVAPDDAWIVGARSTGPDAPARSRALEREAVGMDRQPHPVLAGRPAHLGGRDRDRRRLGDRILDLRNGDAPLILHWDGTTWTEVATPEAARGTRVNQVAIGGDGTAWFLATGASHERGRLLVLDDGMWRVIPLPKELRSGGRAFTLARRDGAWVVGTSVFGDVAFAARLRDTRWTVERLPDGRNLFARSVAMSERGPVVVGTSWIDVASDRGPRWYVARRAHGRWTIELRGGGWLNDVAVAGAAEWTVGQARPAFVTAALRHRPGGWHREPTPAGVEAYLVTVDAWRGRRLGDRMA